MKIVISSDSTCDLGDLAQQNDVQIMPLNVVCGDNDFFDGQIKTTEIFDYVDKTGALPKTAARSIEEYQNHFQQCFKKGDAVVHISLSSEISASYSNACIASKKFKNIIVVDSRSLSSGHGLVVLKACELAKAETNLRSIESKLAEFTSKVQASFVICNLKYLYKGGRCSAVAMFGANLLKIKPSIHLKDGKMVVGKKYMGSFLECLKKYTKNLLEQNQNIDKSKVFITFSSDKTGASEMLEKMLKDFGFENVYKTYAGCTICCHCGPECMGVLFALK